MNRLFVVMGVSGCGKSSVAEALAELTGGTWLDADNFHPMVNKEKMAAGIPLTDEDRWGWLTVLNEKIKAEAEGTAPFFLACSALREVYRERLAQGVDDLRFIYLKGSRELIRSRLEARNDHFMPVQLLDSQFATLEEPADAVVLDIALPLKDLVAQAELIIAAQWSEQFYHERRVGE